MSVTCKTETNGKKKWRAVVNNIDAFGKRHQKVSKWFTKKADALKAEAELRALNVKADSRMTFKEACMEWIAASRSDNTEKTYRDKMNTLATYLDCIADIRLDKISPATIKKVFEQPDFLKLSTSRKNRIRGMMASTFKYVMAVYNFPNNPIDAFPSFKRTEKEKMNKRVIYTPEQFKTVLNQIDDAHSHWEVRNILMFLYLTGMRANECLSLTYQDITSRNTIHIWKQYQEGEWHTLKTENSERTITINSNCIQILEEQRNYYSPMVDFSEEWFVFGGPYQIPYTTLSRVYKEAQMAANLPHSRIHDLRHAHASVLLKNMNGDGDILKISKRLGHSSINTTLGIYAHLLDRSEDDVIDVLDSLF